ncbi:MAG: hypothetical protein Q9165_000846 [Trypethelium subeluteriae]
MTVVYVDEGHGSDSLDSACGSDALPFRTLSEAYLHNSPDDEYKVKKANEDEYKAASKSALKEAVSYAAQQQRKAMKAASKKTTQEAAQQEALAQATTTQIEEDLSLAVARPVRLNDTDSTMVGKPRQSEESKPKAPRTKGPVDVEKQCGVTLPNGAQCARSLTCKRHGMGSKRAVPGRSLPYDLLLKQYQE